ncbi:MAG: alpha/beta fold hydrolase [Gammaproteobacteria bacterium]|nr:alpha/beta fold hydrolase [Gammaproteobacteria bacterium]
MPIKSEKLMLDGPQGPLEAIIDASDAERKPIVAICCHPHPQHQGTMTNKVIHTVARALAGMGATAVRFNFRGVGKSAGEYGEGLGEMDDCRAVIAWAQAQYPDHQLWLAGFSFGSWISAAVAHEYPVSQLISIAPPVERGVFSNMSHPQCDWLAVMGDADEVVSFSATEAWIEQLSPKPDWIVMTGAGHFFHSRLVELREVIEQRLAAKFSELE